VPILDFKSEKSYYENTKLKSKNAILEPDIGNFGTKFCTLETPILNFRKIDCCLPLKGIKLGLIQI
jgi:hypothetical protein